MILLRGCKAIMKRMYVQPFDSQDTAEMSKNADAKSPGHEDGSQSQQSSSVAGNMNKGVYDFYTGTALFRAMKPLMLSLLLSGLYYAKEYGTLDYCTNTKRTSQNNNIHFTHTRSSRWKFTKSQLYSFLLATVNFSTCLRNLSMYHNDKIVLNAAFFTKLLCHVWTTLCCCGQAVCLRACQSYSGIP